jgi:hypothetical protein
MTDQISSPDYVKPVVLSLKGNTELGGEFFIQRIIAQDPSILGLGNLRLIEKERRQRGAGRLDLLLEDSDLDERRWYEVEVQLGATDESHIIRTIEYWDNENRRYPDVDHVAVIVAERITSRYFNVISLFNRHIPMIAIQMTALEIAGQRTVIFTTILNLAAEKPDVLKVIGPGDNRDWKPDYPSFVIELADEVQNLLTEVRSGARLKFNKSYIGTTVDNQLSNFLILRPRRKFVRMSLWLEQSPELDALIQNDGLDVDYDPVRQKYRLQLQGGDLQKHKQLFAELIGRSYDAAEAKPPADMTLQVIDKDTD